jgi:hypothetical protein
MFDFVLTINALGTRKLACSKEPNGCSRCKREGVKCVYSPQKQMGRPRKRRFVETIDNRANGVMEPDFSFLDSDATNLEFLDLLSPTPGNGLMPSSNLLHRGVLPQTHEEAWDASLDLSFGGAALLGDINFDEDNSGDEQVARDINKEISEFLLTMSEETPSLTSGSSPEPTPSPKPHPNSNCSCLSTLCVSLDALSNLPEDIGPAMCTARTAAKVAYEVINCPSCSLNMLAAPMMPVPIQSFQNMMLLGAIIPSAANAYARILELVDEETNRAREEGRDVVFSFRDYGGLWGILQEQEHTCGAIKNYEGRAMDPDTWRIAVRALLRIDVYGLDIRQVENHKPAPHVHHYHLGLKDVIDKLEERSRIRHEKLNEWAAAGGSIHPGCLMSPDTSDKPNCFKIIDIARDALERLIIA